MATSILNYGALDWQVFVFLEKRMPPDRFAKIRNEHFQERITRMKNFVGSGDFSVEQKQAFERFFVWLEAVRELRNHIAHGHLLVRITESVKTPVLTLSLPKDLDAFEAPETRHLEFEEEARAHGRKRGLPRLQYGKNGFLTAYRWDGERNVDPEKYVTAPAR